MKELQNRPFICISTSETNYFHPSIITKLFIPGSSDEHALNFITESVPTVNWSMTENPQAPHSPHCDVLKRDSTPINLFQFHACCKLFMTLQRLCLEVRNVLAVLLHRISAHIKPLSPICIYLANLLSPRELRKRAAVLGLVFSFGLPSVCRSLSGGRGCKLDFICL